MRMPLETPISANKCPPIPADEFWSGGTRSFNTEFSAGIGALSSAEIGVSNNSSLAH